MNILQLYQQAIAKRGGSAMVEIQTGKIEIGDTFEFGGYDWQRVGETVRIRNGYAEIIEIDAQGFKKARRTR